MPRSSPRGKEMRPCVSQDWDGEVLSRQFDEGNSLNAFLRNADRVEGDINASGLLNHRAGVLFDGLVVERIDFSRLDDSSCGTDLLC
jgi:hypothetical protein